MDRMSNYIVRIRQTETKFENVEEEKIIKRTKKETNKQMKQ